MKSRGFTLVELMISMLLGLVALGAVISLIAMNSRNYRTGEATGQIQDSMRTAFELIARDVREARSTGCANFSQTMRSSLASGLPPWWSSATQAEGLVLYSQGVATTATLNNRTVGAAIETHGVTGSSFSITANVDAQFTVPGNTLATGDIVVVCDGSNAEVMSVFTPGNPNVAMTNAPTNSFAPQASTQNTQRSLFPSMTRYKSTLWYIGDNGRGSQSLYRRLGNAASEEMIEGVTDMSVEYRQANSATFTAVNGARIASSSTADIDAIRVCLEFQSVDDRLGDFNARTIASNDRCNTANAPLVLDDQRIFRKYSSIIALRNSND